MICKTFANDSSPIIKYSKKTQMVQDDTDTRSCYL